jgi:hypothetical protein
VAVAAAAAVSHAETAARSCLVVGVAQQGRAVAAVAAGARLSG